MVEPHRKFTPEEIAANAQATAERELKQEGISQFEAHRNRGSERNRRNDDDEISVVSASKRRSSTRIINIHTNHSTVMTTFLDGYKGSHKLNGWWTIHTH